MSPIDSTLRQIEAPSVDFLEDWRDDHRPLDDGHRARAGRYISFIVSGDALGSADPVIAEVMAIELWVRFRDLYDGFRGPYMRSEAEDFGRAMSLL